MAEYILNSAINLSQATVGAVYCLKDDANFHLLAHHGIIDKQRKKAEKVHQKDSPISFLSFNYSTQSHVNFQNE